MTEKTYSIHDIDTNRILSTGEHSKCKAEALQALSDLLFTAGDIENPKDFTEEDAIFFYYEIIKDTE